MKLKHPITVPLSRDINGVEIDLEIPCVEYKEVENARYRDNKTYIEIAYNGFIIRTWITNDNL